MPRQSAKTLSALLIAVLLFSGLNAQTKYSTKVDYLKSKENAQPLFSNFQNEIVDTTISNLADMSFQTGLGGMGLASPLLRLQAMNRRVGFTYFQLPLNGSRLALSDAKYYNTLGPFADLRGAIGAGKLQMFNCFFTQTFKNQTNIALRFNRNTFIGQYDRQIGMLNNLAVTANYESKNRRVGYYFTVLQNTNRNAENGGISNGTLDANTAFVRKDLLSVKLSGAGRDDRQAFVSLRPYLLLNAAKPEAKVLHYLQLNSSADLQSIKYTDSGIRSDGYYSTIYYDSLTTNDSSNIKLYSNDISYLLKTRNNNAALSFGYRNEQIRVWQKNTTYYDNSIAHVEGVLQKEKVVLDSFAAITKRFVLDAVAEQVLMGYNTGDVSTHFKARYLRTKTKSLEVYVGAAFENRKANQNYLSWKSNHFSWQRSFGQQQVIDITGGFNYNKVFDISVLYQNINHLLYFNSVALPAQLSGKTINLAATLSFSKVLFKHLGVYVDHTLQQTSQPDFIKIPLQITQAKLYYSASLFKHVLQLNIGAQVRLHSSFRGYNYMPATQAFYLPSNSRSGGFPYTDIYLSGRIKPVSFYLKLENILAGYVGYNYTLVSGYYQPELAFRMGITWQFWD